MSAAQRGVDLIARAFLAFREHPCWSVQRGHGTFLTFEFGEPHLVIREPKQTPLDVSARVQRALARRVVSARGQWHLWIYCCKWEVREGQRLIGDWSTPKRIERAASYLNGQKLVTVELAKRGIRTSFEFDLGGRMETAPYDRSSEQWLLYEPAGKVLSVRADRRYRHEHVQKIEIESQWRIF